MMLIIIGLKIYLNVCIYLPEKNILDNILNYGKYDLVLDTQKNSY
jgi:hypothetical protein